jgi:NADH dehydrogenase
LLGGRIVRLALEQGQPVRALVRTGSASGSPALAGATLVAGDLKAPDTLPQALEGVDVVISTATAGQRGGDDTVDSVDYRGTVNLIEAAERAGARQFIYVSTLAADPASPVPLFRAKGLAEERLRASSLSHTILKCNGFIDILLPMVVGIPLGEGRPVSIIGEGRRRHSFIAIQDVAAFALAVAGHPDAQNQTIAVGGPEPLSWRDIVTTVEAVTGRQVPLQTLEAGQSLPGLPPVASEVMTVLDSFDSPMDMTETAAKFGVRLTSLEEWLTEFFVGA